MGTHEQCLGATDEWYTPPEVFAALGVVEFALDPCSPSVNAWVRHCHVPAASRFTEIDDGLSQQWFGFVWMNPPFGDRNGLVPWLEKFVQHGNGIALVPDRTSAPWWQQFDPLMDLSLFAARKIKFINQHGQRGKSPAQGTTLWSLGGSGAAALRRAEANKFGILHASAGSAAT